jgi:transcriptional regulator with XRE-family HTH domain
MPDTGLHKRRHAERMKDPEYRAAYNQARVEIAQTDAIIRSLDARRDALGISKAELARRINRNAASIRRLFTASGAKPALPLIAGIAAALDVEVALVPKGEAKAATKKVAKPPMPRKARTTASQRKARELLAA